DQTRFQFTGTPREISFFSLVGGDAETAGCRHLAPSAGGGLVEDFLRSRAGEAKLLRHDFKQPLVDRQAFVEVQLVNPDHDVATVLLAAGPHAGAIAAQAAHREMLSFVALYAKSFVEGSHIAEAPPIVARNEFREGLRRRQLSAAELPDNE